MSMMLHPPYFPSPDLFSSKLSWCAAELLALSPSHTIKASNVIALQSQPLPDVYHVELKLNLYSAPHDSMWTHLVFQALYPLCVRTTRLSFKPPKLVSSTIFDFETDIIFNHQELNYEILVVCLIERLITFLL